MRTLGVRWVNSVPPFGSLGSYGSVQLLDSLGRALGVVRFIQVHSSASCVSLRSFGRALGFVGFIWAHSCGRRVHSGALSESLVSCRICGRRVHLRNLRACLASFGFAGFIQARPEGISVP